MLILLFLVSFCVVSADMASPRVRVVPVIATKKLPDVLVYEGSVPLDIAVNIPTYVHSENVEKCQEGDVDCLFRNSLSYMYKDLDSEFSLVKNTSTDHNRGPRQVVAAIAATAGYLLRPAIHRITTDLFSDDDEIRHQINLMHEDFQNVVRKTEDYSTRTKEFLEEAKQHILGNHRAIDSLDTRIAKALHGIYNLVLAENLHSQFRQGIADCISQKFPTSIVTLDRLKVHLQELNQALNAKGFNIAFSWDKLSSYAKLPLTDCFLDRSTMHIIVNVPIVSSGSKWVLQEIVHKKFAYHGQICEIYPSEAMYVAKDTFHKKFVMITKNLLHHCSPYNTKLCLVPRFARDSSETLHCLLPLLEGRLIENVKPHCGFRCHDNEDMEISQIDESTLIVTNAKNITMFCSGQRHFYSIPKIGSLEIRLSCSCNTYINGMQLQEPIACTKMDYGVSDNIHIAVPNLWSKFDHMLQGSVSEHSGHDEVVDKDWVHEVPIFNFTKRLNTKQPMEQPYSVSLEAAASGATLQQAVNIAFVVFIWKLRKEVGDLKKKCDSLKDSRRNTRN